MGGGKERTREGEAYGLDVDGCHVSSFLFLEVSSHYHN